MTAMDTTAAGVNLQKQYRKVIVRALNEDDQLIDNLDTSAKVEQGVGGELEWLVKLARKTGSVYRGEGAGLPSAKQGLRVAARERPRYLYSPVEITEIVQKRTKGGQGAYVDEWAEQLQDTVLDMKLERERAFLADDYGLAYVTQNVTNDNEVPVNDTTYFDLLGEVDLWNKVAAQKIGNTVYVTEINHATSSITLSEPVTCVASARNIAFYKPAAFGEGIEPVGLRTMGRLGGTLHGIDRTVAANKEFAGNFLDANGAAPNESMITTIQNRQKQRRGGKYPIEVIATTIGIEEQLAVERRGDRRVNDDKAMKIAGGHASVSINNVAVIPFSRFPKGTILGWNKKACFRHPLPDGQGWLKSGQESGEAHVEMIRNGSGQPTAGWQSWMIDHQSLCAEDPGLITYVTNVADVEYRQ